MALFGRWVQGKMDEAEAGLRRRRGKRSPAVEELNAERQKAWEMAVTGERQRRVRRAQGPAEVRRALSILGRM